MPNSYTQHQDTSYILIPVKRSKVYIYHTMCNQNSQVFSLAKDSTPCFWRLRRPSCHTILSSVKLILQNQIKRLYLLVWKSSSLTPCMYFLVCQQVSTISDSSGRRAMYRCLQSWRRGQQYTQKAHGPTIPSIQQTSNSLPTLPSQVFFTHFAQGELTLTPYYMLHTHFDQRQLQFSEEAHEGGTLTTPV